MKGHSEDYFGDYRDFWWNRDFIELMAKRWDLDSRPTLLDIGCGQCHWSRLLVEYLKSPAVITAIDSDTKWAEGSYEIEEHFRSHGAEVEFKHADATALPFEEDSFDVVTCQTVLIHLRDPEKALCEMKRVVRPGGIVICVEPNNIAGNLVKSNISKDDSIDGILQSIKDKLVLERGKVAAGEGDNSFGDLLPGTMSEAGLRDVEVYISDKATPLIPPYDSEGEKVFLQNLRAWIETEEGDQNRAEIKRLLSAYGDEPLFVDVVERLRGDVRRMMDAVDNREYHCAGGTIMYLVSGTKPVLN
ncbi:MAG: methyltransferase domain-containing protein [Pyrinomonadaceae bacterium]|nr:methyltransferase domain-containing protein [Pyrinomonadaceae bacterium]